MFTSQDRFVLVKDEFFCSACYYINIAHCDSWVEVYSDGKTKEYGIIVTFLTIC